MSKNTHVQIISCGPGLSEINDRHGYSFDWVTSMIKDKVDSIEVVKIYNNELPSYRPGDIWIITGSRYSVYDNIDWITSFKKSIRQGLKLKIPMLGICFGHQIVCSVLGADVIKNDMGWEIGSSEASLTDGGKKSDLFRGFNHTFSVYQSHQDVVSHVPESVKVLAQNKYGVQSVSFDETVFGVQFHPEFSFEVMKAYHSIRTKKINNKEKYFVNNANDGIKVVENFINMILRR